MQTVITMTSWTKRINFVPKFIYRFLTTQTVKPDIFYLWLAEQEFPNKEKDLPEDLLLVCESFNVKICWTKDNEYCFKRWYVYPKHFEDLVISVDDDIILSPNTIEVIQNEYKRNPIKQVLHYKNCGGEIEIKNGIEYFIGALKQKSSIKNYFQGNCAFAPYSFPLESFSEEMIRLRKEICPKCDESWLHPFLIKDNIPITFMNGVRWVETEETKSSAISNDLHRNLVEINGHEYKKADLYKLVVLQNNADLLKSWIKVFPNYSVNKFISTDLLKVLH